MSLAIWLHAGRVHRGLSIEEVARITKIQQRILERIESGRFDGLPADVFVRGFVRAFARAVALDENEALRRYSAIGSASGPVASPAARALVETMSDLAPGAAGGIRDVAIGPVVLKELAVEPRDVRVAEGTMRMPAVREAEPVAVAVVGVEPIVEPVPVIEVAAPIVADLPAPAPKKPRRKRKTTAVLAVEIAPDVSDVVIAEAPVVEAALAAPAPKVKKPRARKKTTAVATAMAAETAAETAIVEQVVVATADAASPDTFVSDAIPELVVDEPIEIVEPIVMAEPWSPKMPTVVAPMPPWRRPTFAVPAIHAGPAGSAASAPSLVIDDADPESAERELEDRRAERTHGPSRRSFLPPILLDREDRSRQGGLTLAVIILLIAATLTLSYLMRRPSSSGDGVTRAERPMPTQLV